MSAQKFVVKKKAKTGGKDSKGQPALGKLKPEKKPEVKEEVLPQLPPAKMNICVFGAGATGGTIAAYLKSKMRNIFMVASGEERRLIRSNGLKVESPKGTTFIDLDTRETLNQKVDLVILTVSVDQIKEIIHKNHNFLENTIILTTQDSIRAEKIISLILGEKNIVSSVVMFDAVCAEPNLINYRKEGKWYIGRPFSANDDKIKEIAEELSLAFEMVVVDDIMSVKWAKLFVNLYNCIPALLGKNAQETFADLDMAKLGILLLKEGFQILEGAGIKLTNLPDFGLDKLRQLTQMSIEEAAQSFSQEVSNLGKEQMHKVVSQIINAGYSSQADCINGELVIFSRFNNTGANLNAKAVNLMHRVEKLHKFLNIDELKREFDLNTIK
ncbi:MAG: 2-dehydropantoate 2-reductase N-terminal domain-containing protein [Candidatus Omnitrophica bacterium]|nr:2-dehydropantoate 2-reductase N-terminal domain-containing protein [Candidatus Omnitrophota bacterium]MDD5351695.1 2-dehydropantoate 2-reductase N-terminal domain-containing protein [Candidatus Omnitrophota bacterium]MDD5550905.1 2-dehydropantoate 2-reductase N-terminal domain-containing protein [Candidatus Omnitrophota bacterium]